MSVPVGIIGTGVIAGSHAAAIAKNPELQLVAASEIDVPKGEQFAAENKCRHYQDYRQMLAETPLEVVVVCLPHHLHAEAGRAVLAAGKHLFMEKPLANSVQECDALIEQATAQHRKIMVGHTHHYLVSIRKAFELLQQGAIGRLNFISDSIWAYYNWEKRAPWFLDPAQGGGGPLMNTGPHQVDHLLHFAQSHPVYVKACVGHNRGGVAVESDVAAFVEFANGVTANLLLCQGYKPKTAEVALRLIGTTGLLEVNPWGHVQLSQHGETKELPCENIPGFESEWQEMLAAIRDDREPQTNGAYGRQVVALIDAIYRSGRERRPIIL